MVAVVTVNTDQDIVDPSDQLTSLREAIQMANDLEGADEIVFDFGHEHPVTIQLEHGELQLTDAVTIRGPGRGMLTIDARQAPTSWWGLSVIFHFAATEGDFTVEGLTLNGGTVRSESKGMLTILDSVVTNNQFEWGKGSVIAALSGDVTVRSSTISRNGDSQDNRGGDVPTPGIIWSGNDVTVSDSTISQNATSGIIAEGNVTISSSTISENRGAYCDSIECWGEANPIPGGVWAGGDVAISSSTISGNTGGGVRGGPSGNVTIQASTIVGNLNIGNKPGIGVRVVYGDFVVENSIVAHNLGGDLENNPYDPRADIGRQLCLAENGPDSCGPEPSSEPTWTLRHSLIGHNRGTPLVEAPLGHPDSDGNLVGGSIDGAIAPRLGPLADNGGPTLTHALLPDSPAINMGDPSGVIGGGNLPRFDQRGEPYARVVDGRIDIGAFQRGVPGDANGDGKVNFADFLILADHFGAGQGWAEGNFDGSEDGTQFADFLVLANNFGYEDPGSSTAP